MSKYPLDEIIKDYKANFNEALVLLNKTYGFELKLPYSISSHPNLKLRMGRMIRCAMDRKNSLLIISPEVYDKDFLEVIIVREILVVLLYELVVLNQKIDDFNVFWYDLALLFANFYLGNKHNAFIKSLFERSTISFLNFQDGTKFYCSEKIITVLNDFSTVLTRDKIEILFSNVFNVLKLLKKYGIRLSIREFSIMCDALIDIFSSDNLKGFLKPLGENHNLEFIENIFKKTLEADPASIKDEFLTSCFKLLTNAPENEKEQSILIENLSRYLKDETIKKDIHEIEALITEIKVLSFDG